MSDYVSIAGVRATSARIMVPGNGVWAAEVDLDGDTAIPPDPFAAVIKIGDASFVGTVDPRHSGVWQLRRKLQILGGAGGWSRAMRIEHVHNDAGIKVASIVAKLQARTGERIVNVPDRRLGPDFVIMAVPAAALIRRLVGSWHVDYAGNTQCTAPAGGTPGEYELLSHDPREHRAVVAASDPRAVMVGMALTARLSQPLVVRSLMIDVSGSTSRIHVWGTDS